MDKDKLLAPREDTPSGAKEDGVEVPGFGTIRVRGLNRLEAIHVGRADEIEERDRRMVALAALAPQFTPAEVGRWQKVDTNGEIERVTRKIAELSGMLEGADREAYKSLRGESRAGVRVFPGAETLDDGRSTADGDVG